MPILYTKCFVSSSCHYTMNTWHAALYSSCLLSLHVNSTGLASLHIPSGPIHQAPVIESYGRLDGLSDKIRKDF